MVAVQRRSRSSGQAHGEAITADEDDRITRTTLDDFDIYILHLKHGRRTICARIYHLAIMWLCIHWQTYNRRFIPSYFDYISITWQTFAFLFTAVGCFFFLLELH